MTILRRYAVFVATTVVLGALSGCGEADAPAGAPTLAPTPAKVSKGTAPEPQATVTVGKENGSATFTFEGDLGAGEPTLPKGFPAKQIPITDGDLVGGSVGDANDPYAYTVLIQVEAASPAAVLKAITGQLTRAGFTAQQPGPSTAEISTSTFVGKAYDVAVNVIRAEGKTTVTYLVVKN